MMLRDWDFPGRARPRVVSWMESSQTFTLYPASPSLMLLSGRSSGRRQSESSEIAVSISPPAARSPLIASQRLQPAARPWLRRQETFGVLRLILHARIRRERDYRVASK